MHQKHGPSLTPKHILVPMDFSSSSDAALGVAAEFAKLFNAQLYLLHVMPMLIMDAGDNYYPDEEFARYAQRDANMKLAALVKSLMSEGVEAKSGIEVGNDVVGNIMMVIEREKINMLVLSTHGMSGWRAVVFGSIAEKVTKIVRCPLLLLHTAPPVDTLKDAPQTTHPQDLEVLTTAP